MDDVWEGVGRPPPVTSSTIRNLLAASDPVGARCVEAAWSEHLVVSTSRQYCSIVDGSYVPFCKARGLPPWPTCDVRVAAWLLRICTHVKHTSMRVYMAAVRDAQLTMGYQWDLRGNERLRRSLRWIKRKFPCSPSSPKFPISTLVLRAILPLLRGGRIC